jgi:hypothetical protein
MPDAQGFSYKHWTAVNAVSTTLLEVAGDATNDPASTYFPSKGTLSHVEVEFDNIAGATTVTVLGTWDAAGAFLALPSTTATITVAPSGATEGGVVISADQIQYKQGAGAAKGKFYIGLLLNIGTADARVRVYWRR